MGEMADDIADLAWQEFCNEPEYTVTCTWCKKPGLNWAKIKGKWRVVTPSGKIHKCRLPMIKEVI